MALFSRKTNKDETKAVAAVPAQEVSIQDGYAHVLRNPRITEKASLMMEGSVYAFDVAPDANKKTVMAAVKHVYKVDPRKVAIVNTKPKTVRNMRTGTYGTKSGFKKAYVYLKKGESITIA